MTGSLRHAHHRGLTGLLCTWANPRCAAIAAVPGAAVTACLGACSMMLHFGSIEPSTSVHEMSVAAHTLYEKSIRIFPGAWWDLTRTARAWRCLAASWGERH